MKFPKKTAYFAIALTAGLLAIFSYFFIGVSAKENTVTWGVNFSQFQATKLELDWKEVYTAILRDLNAKHIKIHTNWDLIEKEQGKYDFTDTDWQLAEAERVGAKVIYVVGLKSGRWPECHEPSWFNGLEKEEQQEAILSYVQTVIGRYKNSTAVAFWQVENEPFFMFGECPHWYYSDKEFLRREIAVVKSLDDSREIIVSDSGEFSWWVKAATAGDLVGVTTYRESWMELAEDVGFYFNYPFPSVFYERRALLIGKLFGKKVIGVELQAEPWTRQFLLYVPVEEQEKKMNAEKLQATVEYAKKTGFESFYLWGGEWWYWMKEVKGRPEMWDYSKTLFQ